MEIAHTVICKCRVKIECAIAEEGEEGVVRYGGAVGYRVRIAVELASTIFAPAWKPEVEMELIYIH